MVIGMTGKVLGIAAKLQQKSGPISWMHTMAILPELAVGHAHYLNADPKERAWIWKTNFSLPLCSFRLRKIPLLIWELLSERLRNLRPSRYPYAFFLGDVLAEILQCFEPARPANYSTVQADGHHLRVAFLALFVQHVEGVLHVGIEAIRVAEAGAGCVEFEVIYLQKLVYDRIDPEETADHLRRNCKVPLNIRGRLACSSHMADRSSTECHRLANGQREVSQVSRGKGRSRRRIS